jgi:hypothetical protein
MKQSQFLRGSILVLFLIIIIEALFLFNEFNFFKASSIKEVDFIRSSSDRSKATNNYIDQLFTEFQKGEVKNVFISSTYMGTFEEIKIINKETKGKYPFTANLAIYFFNPNNENMGYYFSKAEIPKIKFYKKNNGKEVEINQKELKLGDKIELILVSDLNKHPEDNLVEARVIKIQ